MEEHKLQEGHSWILSNSYKSIHNFLDFTQRRVSHAVELS